MVMTTTAMARALILTALTEKDECTYERMAIAVDRCRRASAGARRSRGVSAVGVSFRIACGTQRPRVDRGHPRPFSGGKIPGVFDGGGDPRHCHLRRHRECHRGAVR